MKKKPKICGRCGGEILPTQDRIERAEGQTQHYFSADCVSELLHANEDLKQEIDDLKQMISEKLPKVTEP